jgi:predicted MFS family arabinose efflux permease
MFWPFAFYFLMFSGFVFYTPYLVVHYQALGFTGTQIGILTGLTPLITTFGAPLLTGIADSTRRHKGVLVTSMGLAVVGLIMIPRLSSFTATFMVVAVVFLFFSPVTSLIDSATMHMLGNRTDMYGRIRVGGSIGFALAAPLAGFLVEQQGLAAAFIGGGLIQTLCLLTGTRLRFSEAPPGSGGVNLAKIRLLLRDPNWILFLILAFAAGFPLASDISFRFPYLAEIGMTEAQMGIALTLGTVVEIPLMFFGNLLLERFRPYRLLQFAMLTAGVRMVWFGLTNNPGPAFANQLLLNALTIPLLWIAGVAYANKISPEGMKSTGQGVFFATVFGIGLAAGGMIGGPLLDTLGARSMHLVFGAIVFAALGVAWWFGRGQPAPAPS